MKNEVRLRHSLLNTITNCDQFRKLLALLDVNSCKFVCFLLKDELPQIIRKNEFHSNKGGAGFPFLLQYLADEYRVAVCDALRDKLPEIIQSISEFAWTLRYLSLEQCRKVCERVAQRKSVIRGCGDLGYAFSLLDPDRCRLVCETLLPHDKLSQTVKCSVDLGLVLKPLNNKQCKAVCDSIKDALPHIIKKGSDLGNVLRSLGVEQCKILIMLIKDALPQITTDGDQLISVLKRLGVEQQTVLIDSMKGDLPKIIKNAEQLVGMLQFLNVEQRRVVFDSIKDRESQIIPNRDERLKICLKYWQNSDENTAAAPNLMIARRLLAIIQSGGQRAPSSNSPTRFFSSRSSNMRGKATPTTPRVPHLH